MIFRSGFISSSLTSSSIVAQSEKMFFFHSVPPYFWKSFLLFLIIYLLAFPHSNYNPDTHHINNFLPTSHYSQYLFHETNHAKNPILKNPSLLLSYQLPKINLHFQNKKSLMIPDTFDFKYLQLFLLQLYPLHSPHMLLNRKTQKTVSGLKKFVKMK